MEAFGVHAVRGDVLDESALSEGMRGCWGLVHAAADTNHGAATAEQERVNVEGTRTVFRAAREAGVERGLQISSEAVLADGNPIHMADESWPIPEHHVGGYSRTKALAEQAALAESNGDFTVCAIRPRLIWGRDETSALPQIIAAVRSERLKWIGGGNYMTSTAHVTNVTARAIAALERGRAGQVYFITDGEPLPLRRFFTDMLATRGVAAPRADVPRWLVQAAIGLGSWLQPISGGRIKPPMSRQEYATLGHEITVSDARARRELNYAPVLTVQQGLTEMGPGGAWAKGD